MSSWLDRSRRWLGVKSNPLHLQFQALLRHRLPGQRFQQSQQQPRVKEKQGVTTVRNSQFHQLLQKPGCTERERGREGGRGEQELGTAAACEDCKTRIPLQRSPGSPFQCPGAQDAQHSPLICDSELKGSLGRPRAIPNHLVPRELLRFPLP